MAPGQHRGEDIRLSGHGPCALQADGGVDARHDARRRHSSDSGVRGGNVHEPWRALPRIQI